MHATEIVERDVQGNSGFQIVQRFAGRVGLAREPTQVHPYAQICTLDVRSRDAGEIRIPASDSGNCCDYGASAIPLWA